MRRRALRMGMLLLLAVAAGVVLEALVHDSGDRRGAPVAEPLIDPGAPPLRVPRRPPVVLLVADEFPIDAVLGPDGEVDAGRYPNLASLARTGTWFPNASTVYDSTTKAIPAILDGQLPEPGTRPVHPDHPRTIFDLLGPRGYRIVASEEATALCPPRWCPGALRTEPAILDKLASGRRERLRRWIAEIRGGRPGLYVKHVLLPHGPWVYLPSGRLARAEGEPLPGVETVPGFASPAATRFNLQRQAQQLGFLDRELGRLFARMRAVGILDRSMIVLVADHGIATDVPSENRRVATPANLDEIAPVPLFVKRPGQRRGGPNPAFARTVDVVPTIADVLGLPVPYPVDGRSAFSDAVAARTGIRLIQRDFSRVLTMPAGRIRALRAANRRRRLALVGHGDWPSLFSTAGPRRDLLGRRLADLDVAAAGGVRATLAGRPRIATAGDVWPTQVEGRMAGGADGRVRDLVLAVDGTVVAVGRSFHLAGDRRESFAIDVPELALRGGRNDVRLFEPLEGDRLRPLGRF